MISLTPTTDWWAPVEDAVDRLPRTAWQLTHASTRAEAMQEWDNFLGGCSRVFEKLKEASKAHSSLRSWYESKVDERATEPVLLYLHVARNQDHHGVVDDATMGQPTRAITPARRVDFGEGGAVSSPDPLFPHQVRQDFELKLRSVSDRRHASVDPPLYYRGQWISAAPEWIGSRHYARDLIPYAVSYFQGLLAEAKAQTIFP
jgi:hypothetical protein